MKTKMAIIPNVTTQEEIAMLEEALIVWRTNQTKARGNVSLNSFADYLGASRSIVSMWMLGERDLTEKYKKIIALPLYTLIGHKAYEVLNVTPADADLERLIQVWKFIPENIRRAFVKQGESFVTEEKNGEQPIRRSRKAT